MKNEEFYLAELKEIRQMMEQSSRFLSLSGLSGILIGIYAIVSSLAAYRMVYLQADVTPLIVSENMKMNLILLGSSTLLLSLATIFWLTFRRIRKSGRKFWSPGSRLLVINLAIPLISGGILILIFIVRGIFGIVAPSCLIFYGLALINSAKFTRQEIFYLGLLQLSLGLLAALFPNFSLLFWGIGFGMVHLIYGSVMYFKYEYKAVSA